MEKFCKKVTSVLLTAASANALINKGEFQSENIRPPAWMLGEYYTVNQGYFDQYLYIVSQVYIEMGSDYEPKDGSLVQMFAQFETNPRGDENDDDLFNDTFYESWGCAVRYFEDLTNKTKDDQVMLNYYEGNNPIFDATGTFQAANIIEQVDDSVWNNDAELSYVKLSAKNAVGDKYMIFMCGMYRKLEDEYSTMQLKVGDSIPWQFGYKVFSSKGDYTPDIKDQGSGALLVLEQASGLMVSAIALAATTLTLLSF